ncbi:Hpt domain-containing protein [Marinoscillum furvescens]|uniref:Hpt domain-containing protein n=1 Tax=Marinoscillum furvescens DSM 4134 TaxID=1122208 RepID=A0A3D9KYS2_MARFU|nr:Hpt domain-containing protein [Marinoscillum furvescens]RED93877.1 Hpt domain-containing protein [Marinoscillum furvescens DSM 4134]
MDLSYLNSISDGDKAFIEEFILTFESNSGKILSELKETWNAGDLDQARKLAHQLKPSLQMLSLKTLDTAIRIQNEPETANMDMILEMESECTAAVSEMRAFFSL